MVVQQHWVPFSAFISHKTSQVGLLIEVTQRLRGAGIHVNVAEWHYQAGRPLYDGKIRELLRSSDCLVVIMTREAYDSPDIQQEVGAMWAHDKPIVALIEEGLRLPGMLGGKEEIYFNYGDLPGKLDELVKAVTYHRQEKQNTWMKRGLVAAVLGGLVAYVQQGVEQKERKPSRDDKLLTIPEAAEYARYSESSIRRWIREGELGYWEDDYGTRYVNKNELDAFLISTGRA